MVHGLASLLLLFPQDPAALVEKLVEVLERLRPGVHEIILESDAIRIVGERDGRDFWNDWWDDEEEKKR